MSGRHVTHARGVEAVDQPLSAFQHTVQAAGERLRCEAGGHAVVHAEQRGVAGGIPAVHHPVTERERRRARCTKLFHLEPAGRVGLDVDGIELDPPRGEQLSRLGAG